MSAETDYEIVALREQVAGLRAALEAVADRCKHAPDVCLDCARACTRDVTLSGEQWWAIVPGSPGGGGGYLCATCMAERGKRVVGFSSCHMVFASLKDDYDFWRDRGHEGPLYAVLRPWPPYIDRHAPDRIGRPEALPNWRGYYEPFTPPNAGAAPAKKEAAP